MRAWELEEFDAVLLVDSDLTVLGDLSHIFTLPTPFAAVPDQDPVAPAWWFGSLGKIQGGMLFIRPCRAVAQHMISMLQHDRLLHFEYEYAEQVRCHAYRGASHVLYRGASHVLHRGASHVLYRGASQHMPVQDFLDWYFKFDRWLLPLEYNSVLPIIVGNKTQGGMVAKAIHFTKHKPYVRNPAVPQHWYLTCTPLSTISGEMLAEEEEGKAYRGRRYGGDFGRVLGSGDASGSTEAPVAPLQHSRPPVERVAELAERVAELAAAPARTSNVTGTVRVQVTIPAQVPSGDTNASTPLGAEDELRQRVL